MQKLIVVGLLISFYSCSVFSVIVTDTANDESTKEVNDFLNKGEYYFDYSFFLIDSLAHKLSEEPYAINTYKLSKKISASPVQLRIYGENGELLNGYSQCFGSFILLNILKDYPYVTYDHLPINYDLRLFKDLSLIDIPKSSRAKLRKSIDNAEYTYVLYYNIWSKYYSKIILNQMTKFKRMHSSESICIILVNTGI